MVSKRSIYSGPASPFGIICYRNKHRRSHDTNWIGKYTKKKGKEIQHEYSSHRLGHKTKALDLVRHFKLAHSIGILFLLCYWFHVLVHFFRLLFFFLFNFESSTCPMFSCTFLLFGVCMSKFKSVNLFCVFTCSIDVKEF